MILPPFLEVEAEDAAEDEAEDKTEDEVKTKDEVAEDTDTPFFLLN